MKCGTYAGYKKHRKLGEQLCQPCRDAMNAYRREYAKRKPEKGVQYKRTYVEKNKPIRQAAVAAKKEARKAASVEKAEKLAAAKAVAKAEREAAALVLKQEKQARTQARESKILSNKLRDLLRYVRYQNLLISSQIAKHDRRQAIEAQKEQIKLKKEAAVATQQLKREQRELERQRLLKQHGTSIGDYQRCKRNNTTACPDCLKAASAYRRKQVAKDPAKFKQQEKDYYKKYPHKKNSNSRDRARKRGVPSQYYTRQHLFDRDGYDCYLCNLPVDITANHIQGQPGWELYPHIEHVIPLALGGHDTLDNVKIAHALCNIRKGASAPVAI